MSWEKWAAIGQLAGAAATLLAVITSLYLARRADRPKAQIHTSIWVETGASDPKDWTRLAVFMIRNKGGRPLHVSTIGWRTGGWPFLWPTRFQRQHAVIGWWDVHYGEHPPLEVPAFRQAMPRLSLKDVLESVTGMSGGPFFARRWPLLGLQRTPVYAIVHLEEGSAFSRRVGLSLEEELFKAELRKSQQG